MPFYIPGKFSVSILLLFALFAISPGLGAQQTTEQFIPIGMSPGVSGKLSLVGNISLVDSETNSFSMMIDGSSRRIKVSPTTRIWLDRSKSGESNIRAGMEALQPGLRVEVFPRPGNQESIDWIKIEGS